MPYAPRACSADHKLNLEQLSHLLKILRPFLHPYLNGPHSKLGAKVPALPP